MLASSLAEQVVRDAGLVGTRSAEERPALQHQWAAAEATEDGGAEPACAPPADEDRIEVVVA